MREALLAAMWVAFLAPEPGFRRPAVQDDDPKSAAKDTAAAELTRTKLLKVKVTERSRTFGSAIF